MDKIKIDNLQISNRILRLVFDKCDIDTLTKKICDILFSALEPTSVILIRLLTINHRASGSTSKKKSSTDSLSKTISLEKEKFIPNQFCQISKDAKSYWILADQTDSLYQTYLVLETNQNQPLAEEHNSLLINLWPTILQVMHKKGVDYELDSHSKRSRELLSAISDLIFYLDKDGFFLEFSAKNKENLYTKAEEFIGKKVSEVLPADISNEGLRKIKETLRTKIESVQEYSLELNGLTQHFEARYMPAENDQVLVLVRDITKKKWQQEQLDLHNYLLENSKDFIYRINSVNAQVEYCNSNAAQQLGYTQDEVSDLSFTKIELSYSSQRDWKSCVQQIREGKQRSEGTHRTKSGKFIPVEMNSQVIIFNGREYILIIARDLRERIQAESEIRKLLRAIEQSPSSIVITDTKGSIEYVNPIFTDLTGYTFEEVAGQNPRVLKSGKQKLEFYREMWDTIVSGRIWHGEFHNQKKDGSYYWENASISPIKDISGRITHYVAVKENITARKEMEDALKKSEERFRTMADFTYDWEYWVNPAGEYIYISPSCQRVSGYSAEAFIKNPALFGSLIHPDDRELISGHFNEDLQETEAAAIEFRIITKDKKEKWIGHVCQSVYSPDGTWLGRRGSNRDITIQKNSEQQMRRTETLKTVKELAAAISHEFSQPIQALSNYMGILEISNKKIDYIDKMKASISRISELVNNLRDITSIQRQEYLSSQILDLKQSAAQTPINGRKNVLIVDDEPDILDTIVEIISKAGYECSGASDGFEALKIIEKKEFDLIISDINMPRMSGTALFKKVREIGVDSKFIFMTGYALSDETEKTIEGSDGLLHKPVDYNTILALIEKTANMLGDQ